MLAVAVDNFHRQFGASNGEDGTNYFMPDSLAFKHDNALVFIIREMGVNLEGFYRLSFRNIFANHDAVDGHNVYRIYILF